MQFLIYLLPFLFIILSLEQEYTQKRCQVKQFLDFNSNCQSCDPQCKFGCFGYGNQSCFKCKKYIQDNNCVDQCSDGYFTNNQLDFVCKKCSIRFCIKCSNLETCQQCQDNFILQNQLCIPNQAELTTFYIDEENQNNVVIINSYSCPVGMKRQSNYQCQYLKQCSTKDFIDQDTNNFQLDFSQIGEQIQMIQVENQIFVYTDTTIKVIDADFFSFKFRLNIAYNDTIIKFQYINEKIYLFYKYQIYVYSNNAREQFNTITRSISNIQHSTVSQIFSINGNETDSSSLYLFTTSDTKWQGYMHQLNNPENIITLPVGQQIENMIYDQKYQYLFAISINFLTFFNIKEILQINYVADSSTKQIFFGKTFSSFVVSQMFFRNSDNEPFVILMTDMKLSILIVKEVKILQFELSSSNGQLLKTQRVIVSLYQDNIKFYLIDKILENFQQERFFIAESDGVGEEQLNQNFIVNESNSVIYMTGVNSNSKIWIYSKINRQDDNNNIQYIVLVDTIFNQQGDIREIYHYFDKKSNLDKIFLLTKENNIWQLDNQTFQFTSIQVQNINMPAPIIPDHISSTIKAFRDSQRSLDILVSQNNNLKFSIVVMKNSLIIRRKIDINTGQEFEKAFPDSFSTEMDIIIQEKEGVIIIRIFDEEQAKIGFLSIDYFSMQIINYKIFNLSQIFSKENIRLIYNFGLLGIKFEIYYYNVKGEPQLVGTSNDILPSSMCSYSDYIAYAEINEQDQIQFKIIQISSNQTLVEYKLDRTFLSLLFINQDKIFILQKNNYLMYDFKQKQVIESVNIKLETSFRQVQLEYVEEYNSIFIYLYYLIRQYYVLFLDTQTLSNEILPGYFQYGFETPECLSQLQIIEQNSKLSFQIITYFYSNNIYYFAYTTYKFENNSFIDTSYYSTTQTFLKASVKYPIQRLSYDYLSEYKVANNLNNFSEKFVFDQNEDEKQIDGYKALKRFQTENNYIIDNYIIPSAMKEITFNVTQINGVLLKNKILMGSNLFLYYHQNYTEIIQIIQYYDNSTLFFIKLRNPCKGILPQVFVNINSLVFCQNNTLSYLDLNSFNIINEISLYEYKVNCTDLCNVQFSIYSNKMFINQIGILDYETKQLHPNIAINISNELGKQRYTNVFETTQTIVIFDQNNYNANLLNRNNLNEIQTFIVDQCDCNIIHQSVIGEQIFIVYQMKNDQSRIGQVYDIIKKTSFIQFQQVMATDGTYEAPYQLCEEKSTVGFFIDGYFKQFKLPLSSAYNYISTYPIQSKQQVLACTLDYLFLYTVEFESFNLALKIISNKNYKEQNILLKQIDYQITLFSLDDNGKPNFIMIPDKSCFIIYNLVIGLESKFIYVSPQYYLLYDSNLDFILSFKSGQDFKTQMQLFDTSEILPWRLNKFSIAQEIQLKPSYYLNRYSSFFNVEKNSLQIYDFQHQTVQQILLEKNNIDKFAFQKSCVITNNLNNDDLNSILFITITQNEIIIYSHRKILWKQKIRGELIKANDNCTIIYTISGQQPLIEIYTYNQGQNNYTLNKTPLDQSIEQITFFEISNKIYAYIDQSQKLWIKNEEKLQNFIISNQQVQIQTLSLHMLRSDSFSIIISYDDGFTMILDNDITKFVTKKQFYNQIKNIIIIQSQLYVSDERYIYRFIIDTVAQKNDEILKYYNKLPIQFRGYQKLKQLSNNLIVLMGQSRLNIYTINNNFQIIKNIKNNKFQYISDTWIIQDQYLIIVDQVGVYIYNYNQQFEINLESLIDSFNIGSAQLLNPFIYQNKSKKMIQLQMINQSGCTSIKVELKDFSINSQLNNNYDCLQEQNLKINSTNQILQTLQIYSSVGSYLFFDIDNDDVQEIFIPSQLEFDYSMYMNELRYNLNGRNVSIYSNYNETEDSTSIYNTKIEKLTIFNGTILPDKYGRTNIIFKKIQNFNFENLNIIDIKFKFQDPYTIQFNNVNFLNINTNVAISSTPLQYFYLLNCNYYEPFVTKNFLNIEKVSVIEIRNITFLRQINEDHAELTKQYSTDQLEKILSNTSLIKINIIGNLAISQINFIQITVPFQIIEIGSVQIANIEWITMINVNQIFKYSNINKSEGYTDIYQTDYNQKEIISLIKLKYVSIQATIKTIRIANSYLKSLIYADNYQQQDTIAGVQALDVNKKFSLKVIDIEATKITFVKQPQSQSFPYINILILEQGSVQIENIKGQDFYNFQSILNLKGAKDSYLSQLLFDGLYNCDYVLYFQNVQDIIVVNPKFDNAYNLTNYIYFQDTTFIVVSLQINSNYENQQDKKFETTNSAINVKFTEEISKISSDSRFLSVKIFNINSLSDGAAIKIESYSEKQSVGIYGGNIQNNMSYKNGGALYVKGSNITLINTIIANNQAHLSGGGIYSIESYLSFGDQVSSSEIKNNKARIGGGIRYFCKNKDSLPSILNQSSIAKIFNNSAIHYGNNYAMYAKQLIIKKNSTSFQNVISTQKSSTVLIEFYWIDEEGNTLNYKLDDSLYTDQSLTQAVNDEIKDYLKIQITSPNIRFNSISNSYQVEVPITNIQYNDQQQFLYSELYFLLSPGENSEFNITAPLNGLNQAYTWQINASTDVQAVNFRECISGEVYSVVQNDFIECRLCTDNTYSLSTIKDTSISCQPCPNFAKKCEADQIIIDNGYWKEEGTQNIEYCLKQPSNCVVGQQNQTCSIGNVGPRCESCDYSSSVWESGPYGKIDDYDCVQCSSLSYNYKKMSLLVLFSLLFGIYQIYLAIRLNNNTHTVLKAIYLKRCGILCIGDSFFQSKFDTLIKFVVNYFQYIQVLTSFRFNISTNVQKFIFFFGNPLRLERYSFDCLFIEYGLNEKIDMVYLRLIWNIIISFLYLIITLIGTTLYSLYIQRGKPMKCKLAFIVMYGRTSIFYLYYLLYPSWVLIYIQILSCEKIGDKQYLEADTQYECFTPQHKMFAYYISIPLLFITVFALPFWIFFISLRKYKNKLNHVNVYIKFSFFYQEYKDQYYYWEVFKIISKSLIYAAIYVINENDLFKGSALGGIMLIYTFLTFKIRPYKKNLFNFLDFISGFTLFISFQLGMLNLTSDNEITQSICLILLVVINSMFTFTLLAKLMQQKVHYSKYSRFYKVVQIFNYIAPKFAQKHFIEINKYYKSHKSSWNKVRKAIKKIIQSQNKYPFKVYSVKLISQSSLSLQKQLSRSIVESDKLINQPKKFSNTSSINQQRIARMKTQAQIHHSDDDDDEKHKVEDEFQLPEEYKKRQSILGFHTNLHTHHDDIKAQK